MIKPENLRIGNFVIVSNDNYGFPIFCKEGNIYGDLTTISPKIQVGEQPTIPFDHIGIDPCEGVSFQ